MTTQPKTTRSTRRFTVDEYHRMAEAGILDDDDRVELIEGKIVETTPIGSRHASCVSRLTRLFVRRVGDDAIVWPQNPIRLGDHSEPEPDLALLEPTDDDYQSALPTADDTLLVVEVADTTLDEDRHDNPPCTPTTESPPSGTSI